ncbi:MAG TPA: BON domain-containing protein [Gemmataceae bacterium]|jgi:osmotically-inducible protein OsmY|nr:BON domain-containing protein [Gemmataceae bacterium]
MGALTRRRVSWVVLVVALGMAGCKEDDTTRLASVGHKLAQRAEAAVGSADGKLFSGLQVMGGDAAHANLTARVTTRLRWDKALANTNIEVSESEGTVELKGTVQEPAQKQRALELAESTEGVDKVTDSLEIAAKEPARDQ